MTIEIERRRDGRMEIWWLDSPSSRNSIDQAMWSSLIEHSARIHDDTEVRLVVLRGRGENFSAGADLKSLGRSVAADHGSSNYRAINQAAERAVSSLPVPVLAAIDGACIGGGVQLALACDLRVATTRARFAVTPAKLGITYPALAVERLVAVVGPSTATELLLTADEIDAPTALRVGLINRVVDDLDEGVSQLADSLLARSPTSQAAAKAVVAAVWEGSAETMRLGQRWEKLSILHDDLDEGLRAFAEKRPPRFGSRSTSEEQQSLLAGLDHESLPST